MAIKKISEFPKVTPSAEDKIIIEKNGEGGHINLSEMPVSTLVNDRITKEVKDLNDKIDTLAFEPGDTKGDAELRDIRRPATGFTVPANANAGDAVRAQVTQLDDKISNLKGDLDEIDNRFSFAYGKNRCSNSNYTQGYITENGNIVIGLDWYTTDYIDVKGLETITASYIAINGYQNELPFFFCEKYDSRKNKVGYENSSSNVMTITNDVEYIRFGFHNDQTVNIQVESGNDITSYEPYKKINRLDNCDYALKSEITNDYITIVGKNKYSGLNDVNGYLEENGTITQYNDWKTTDFIDVEHTNSVYASCSSSVGGSRDDLFMFFVGFYNAEKTLISYNSNLGISASIPSTVKYIRFSYHSDITFDIQIEKGTAKTDYEPYTETKVKKYEKPWYGKKWVCVGDSLTEHNLRTNLNYHDYIADKTGISVINFGQSGTGYKRSEDENHAFYQRVSEIPTDVDVVTIFGSGNDLLLISSLGNPTDTTTDTICGCVNKTIDTIINLIPNVSLGIVSPTPWVGQQPSDNNCEMARYSEALRQICINRSIPFLDLYHCSNLRPWTEEGRNACYTKDEGNGVHPDENGHKLLAPRFKAFLETLLM